MLCFDESLDQYADSIALFLENNRRLSYSELAAKVTAFAGNFPTEKQLVFILVEMNAQSSYPVVGVIEPGVLALENSNLEKDDNILIMATRATITSRRYEKALEKLGHTNITSLQTGLFVPLVEEGIFEGKLLDATMEHYFSTIAEPKAIILGCTHFPLIGNVLKKYFNNKPLLIHSGEAIVEYLEARYDLSQKKEEANLKIFASDNVAGLRKIADSWL